MAREVKHDLLDQAVRNNALWCHAVCAAQGKTGDFTASLWSSVRGSPPYYPDAVTLTRNDTAKQQASIVELARLGEGKSWSVKDSYACLSLENLGFAVLLDAQWIALSAGLAALRSPRSPLTWRRVDSAGDLRDWKTAWAHGDSTDIADEIFHDTLLSHPEVVFLVGVHGEDPVGGALLYAGDGVVGLTNVFSTDAFAEEVWDGLVSEASALFPDLALVGYENKEDVAPALAAGFRTIGDLRIWRREDRATVSVESAREGDVDDTALRNF